MPPFKRTKTLRSDTVVDIAVLDIGIGGSLNDQGRNWHDEAVLGLQLLPENVTAEHAFRKRLVWFRQMLVASQQFRSPEKVLDQFYRVEPSNQITRSGLGVYGATRGSEMSGFNGDRRIMA